jgi:hypothetical protein
MEAGRSLVLSGCDKNSVSCLFSGWPDHLARARNIATKIVVEITDPGTFVVY